MDLTVRGDLRCQLEERPATRDRKRGGRQRLAERRRQVNPRVQRGGMDVGAQSLDKCRLPVHEDGCVDAPIVTDRIVIAALDEVALDRGNRHKGVGAEGGAVE